MSIRKDLNNYIFRTSSVNRFKEILNTSTIHLNKAVIINLILKIVIKQVYNSKEILI